MLFSHDFHVIRITDKLSHISNCGTGWRDFSSDNNERKNWISWELLSYTIIGANWFNLVWGGGWSPDYSYIEFVIVCGTLINGGGLIMTLGGESPFTPTAICAYSALYIPYYLAMALTTYWLTL